MLRAGYRMFSILLIFCLLLHKTMARDAVFCSPGTLLVLGENGAHDRCDPCPKGTFNDQKSHRQVFCQDCSMYDLRGPMLELVTSCTPYHDTVVRCSHREFYFSNDYKTCKQCDICEFRGQYVGRQCQDYEDTVCCPRRDMVYWDGACRPITYCGVGEYLKPRSNGQHDECRRCPAGTTNYESSHQRESCQSFCLDIKKWRDHRLIDRAFSCRAGECKVDRSCRRQDGVMCRVCPSETENPVHDAHLPLRNASEYRPQNVTKEPERHFPITVLMVSMVVAVLVLAVVSLYILTKRGLMGGLGRHYMYRGLSVSGELSGSDRQFI